MEGKCRKKGKHLKAVEKGEMEGSQGERGRQLKATKERRKAAKGS